MTDDEFRAHLTQNLYINIRKLPDGWVAIMPQIFNWALCVDLDDSGYPRRYDYDDLDRCRAELEKMGSVHDVPVGWTRRLPEPFFFTIVGYEDERHLGECMTEREIITHAELAGYMTTRTMTRPATLDEAVQILNEGNRAFEIFDTATQKLFFIGRAECLGFGKEAVTLVKSYYDWRKA